MTLRGRLGGIAAATAGLVAPHVHTAVAGDVNEDGHFDLLVDHRDTGAVRVLTGRGDGTFDVSVFLATGGDRAR